MFRTITSNPLVVTQGSHICAVQQDVDSKAKIKPLRYVLIDSDSLESEHFDKKEDFEQAVQLVVEQAEQNAKKKSTSSAEELAE
jgi:hypothetical protein